MVCVCGEGGLRMRALLLCSIAQLQSSMCSCFAACCTGANTGFGCTFGRGDNNEPGLRRPRCRSRKRTL